MLDDCKEFARKYPNFVLGVIGSMLTAPFGLVVMLAISGLHIDMPPEFEVFIGGVFAMYFLGVMLMIIATLRAIHRRAHPRLYPSPRPPQD